MKEISSKRELNKAMKKASLTDAAEKLFILNGFENTSIDEVAKEAGLTKRTLYQYFQSKEDLFYAVVLKGGKRLFNAFEGAMSRGNNVLEKVRLANQAYLQFYMDNQGMFQLLNYKPANQQNNEQSPHYRELAILDARRVQHYLDLVATGKSDGSINSNLETRKAVYFAFFSAFSLLYTTSSTVNLWEMLGFTENEFLQFSFDLLADALE